MLFVLQIIAVLAIGVVNGLRNCEDCTEILECTDALNRMIADKSDATRNLVQNAQCGCMKVCCSDFSVSARKATAVRGKDIVSNEINDEDEIENHPKVNLLPDECGTIEGGRIIGGKRAKMNEFPWLALISHKVNGKLQFNCGGTVINERYVLTAAHCIKGKVIAGVRVGEYDISSRVDCTGLRALRTCQSNLQDVRVTEAIMHPNYIKFPITINDIGLLRLKKPLNLTVDNAGSSCLPVLRSLREMDIAGKTGVVAGWGITEDHTRSDVLLKVDVPIHDKETCKSLYDKKRTSRSSIDRFGSTFCAGELNHDSCGGDSGGPLMIEAPLKNDMYKMIQFGIVSYGPSQCGSETPGVYTDVKKFLKWILDTIQP